MNPVEGGIVERPPGHCSDDAAWKEFVRQYAGRPRSYSDFSDFALANAVFMAGRDDLNLIVMQTAAKERIRWLSIRLAEALAEVERLTKERDGWRKNAEHHFGHMRAALDLSYALQWLFNPETLERAAEKIDCGDGCENAWREYDTNATGCTMSDSAEGCPFELASDLREIAKAIRIQAWTLAFNPRPAPSQEDAK